MQDVPQHILSFDLETTVQSCVFQCARAAGLVLNAGFWGTS